MRLLLEIMWIVICSLIGYLIFCLLVGHFPPLFTIPKLKWPPYFEWSDWKSFLATAIVIVLWGKGQDLIKKKFIRN